MSLEQKDIELIEHLVYKANDDVAVSIARSFERLEERIDAVESRLYSRIAEGEDSSESDRQDIIEAIRDLKNDVRDMSRHEF